MKSKNLSKIDEADILRLYDKLQKNELFNDWKSIQTKTMNYMLYEWEEVPNPDELSKLSIQMMEESDFLERIMKVCSEEEVYLLAAILTVFLEQGFHQLSKNIEEDDFGDIEEDDSSSEDSDLPF